jgi:hypothetical protein
VYVVGLPNSPSSYARNEMKAIFVILILLVVCVVLFVTAIASPNASKWLQKRVDRLSKFGERKGDRKAASLAISLARA